MKKTIVFSSLTGNTKKLAYEILKVMPEDTDIYDLKELDHDLDDELLILGYWVDRAKPNKEMCQLMEGLKGKKIITFGTLGAYPDSEYAEKTKQNVVELIKEDNEVLGNFLCQGKIDPKITEMFKKNAEGAGHTMTAERMKRHEDASKHPNEDDFIAARKFIEEILNNLKEESF